MNRLHGVAMKFGLGKHNFIVRIKSDQIMYPVVLHATDDFIEDIRKKTSVVNKRVPEPS